MLIIKLLNTFDDAVDVICLPCSSFVRCNFNIDEGSIHICGYNTSFYVTVTLSCWFMNVCCWPDYWKLGVCVVLLEKVIIEFV